MSYIFTMRKHAQKSIQIPADIEEFDQAQEFVEELLERTSVSREIAHATSLVFEAVFGSVLMQGIDRNTMLTISAEDRLGGIYLKIGYEGKRFTPPEEDDDGVSPELRLLEGYADKVSYSYRSGYNTIRISVYKSQRGYYLVCGAGILLAIVVYAILNTFLGAEEQKTLLNDYLFPFERLFANAMLMVGAPVTFFSLLKNASETLVVSERILNARKLHVKAIATSAFAVLLALGLSLALVFAFSGWRGYGTGYTGTRVEWSFAEGVVSMIPSSIFAPFEAVSPIPLIVVALLVSYAMVSAGKDFDALKAAIDVCYGLFSRMLGAVMAALPVASFLAIMNVLLQGSYETLFKTLALIFFAFASTSVLFATYALRLKAKGIKVGPFVKKLMPLLRENSAIGSAIEAAPYNIRYCVRHFGMDRSRLSRILPALAQINRDGNCYLIMFVAMLFLLASDIEFSVVNIVVIAALVLFLSFGAPNQPGSILIGTLIIITYLNSNDAIGMAIYLEVFLGGLQNMVNVISDIVTVAEEEGVRYEE